MGGTLKYRSVRRRCGHRSAGFTLLELLTALAIVAIMLSLGVPSYHYVTTKNRASAEVNALFGDMQYARAEAIRQGVNIVVCVSTDGVTCQGTSTAWNQGWIICSDAAATNDCAAAQAHWRYNPAFNSTDTFTADNATSQIIFNREGFAVLPNVVTVTLHDATANSSFTRCVRIERAGTLSTQLAGVPNCT
jgi:type IV fimbrial biogenesis protein FimT